jgi:hypothetical protein
MTMNLNDRADRGQRATELLNNEIFSDALANLRSAIFQKWEECPIRDKEAQHELHLMLKLMTDLVANIKVFMNDGKKAQFELDSIRKADELRKRTARYS